ncbi:hypothetical protein FRC01_011925 [Tulasnella sp. 417]|nr:hypothetical protein FRC01_011925 [Tulasnella sp. 417]
MACASSQGIKQRFEDLNAGGEDAVAYQAVALNFLLLPEEWKKQGPAPTPTTENSFLKEGDTGGSVDPRVSKKHLP